MVKIYCDNNKASCYQQQIACMYYDESLLNFNHMRYTVKDESVYLNVFLTVHHELTIH